MNRDDWQEILGGAKISRSRFRWNWTQSCGVPTGYTITLEEWHRQQERRADEEREGS